MGSASPSLGLIFLRCPSSPAVRRELSPAPRPVYRRLRVSGWFRGCRGSPPSADLRLQITGSEQRGDIGSGAVNLFRKFEPGHSRHGQIGHHSVKIGGVLAKLFQRGYCLGESAHPVAAALQQARNQKHQRLFIIYVQDVTAAILRRLRAAPTPLKSPTTPSLPLASGNCRGDARGPPPLPAPPSSRHSSLSCVASDSLCSVRHVELAQPR